MIKITKQNWYLDLIHLALQYCIAWLFTAWGYFLTVGYIIEGKLFDVITIMVTILLFVIYRASPLKVGPFAIIVYTVLSLFIARTLPRHAYWMDYYFNLDGIFFSLILLIILILPIIQYIYGFISEEVYTYIIKISVFLFCFVIIGFNLFMEYSELIRLFKDLKLS